MVILTLSIGCARVNMNSRGGEKLFQLSKTGISPFVRLRVPLQLFR